MTAAAFATLALLAGSDPGSAAPQVAEPPAAAVQATQQPERGAPPTGESLEAQTRELASKLRCVVCQGLSIEDSPSELAREMKGVIREQLAAGRTPEEVTEYFVARYGEFVLLAPEPRGFNLVVYLAPVLALLGGAGFLALRIRSWVARPEDGVTDLSVDDDDAFLDREAYFDDGALFDDDVPEGVASARHETTDRRDG